MSPFSPFSFPQLWPYGELAGFEPVVGLYAALVAMIAYALFGSSRQVIIGPEATTAILVATIVAPMAGGDFARYASLAAALAISIGLICLLAGHFKIGFVADFLVETHPHRLHNRNRLDSNR